MGKLYQLIISSSHHKINTSEICADVPILNIQDVFKNCLLFGPRPGFHISYITGGCMTS